MEQKYITREDARQLQLCRELRNDIAYKGEQPTTNEVTAILNLHKKLYTELLQELQ
ncbi:MAG: hypothetical protein OXR66_02600 [Candidatus Woesearchaeota archaeon]|nr:hypothetical protein [Candidatus Woesearchaeota archaeon]